MHFVRQTTFDGNKPVVYGGGTCANTKHRAVIRSGKSPQRLVVGSRRLASWWCLSCHMGQNHQLFQDDSHKFLLQHFIHLCCVQLVFLQIYWWPALITDSQAVSLSRHTFIGYRTAVQPSTMTLPCFSDHIQCKRTWQGFFYRNVFLYHTFSACGSCHLTNEILTLFCMV